MNETFTQWLGEADPFAGVLACAVRGSCGTSVCRSWVDGFSDASLENALRCVADLFQVIQQNRIVMGRVRWVFGNALLHCERRSDGMCFGIFTKRADAGDFDADGLEKMFVQFRVFGMTGAVAA